MTRRSRGGRALWLVAAVLQLALPGAAAWADARLDAAAAGAKPHVESHATSSCARVHRSDCLLCRFLTAPLEAARPAAVRLPSRETRAPTTTALVLSPARPAARLPFPRAPPTLS